MVLSLPPSAEGVLSGPTCSSAPSAPATSMPEGSTFRAPTCNRPAWTSVSGRGRCASVAASFLGMRPWKRKLKDYILDEIDLRGDGAHAEARCPYLIELKERLDLPAGLRGKANPKSSTGRIDVFTRVITDHSDRFDEIAPGYQGPLYLEVVPLSFAVRVREDLTLNQLRLSIGRPWLTDDQVRAAHEEEPILFRMGSRFRPGAWCFPRASSWVSTSTATPRDGSGTARGRAPPCLISRRIVTSIRLRSGIPSIARTVIAWCSRRDASTSHVP